MNTTLIRRGFGLLLATACLWMSGNVLADGDLPSKFLNRDSVGKTRHNLTQRQTGGGGPTGASMDQFRNDYEEVCVYCHTPHGANRTVTAPLWNRTMRNNTYQTYDLLGTASRTQPVTTPGINSLTCLSCHDGTTAVDSIINMPGAGRFNQNQETVENTDFLNNEWNNRRGPDATVHARLAPGECLACHAAGVGIIGAGATDFTAFVIGTDLRNDHPVGIRYPDAGAGTDFKDPQRKEARMAYFDNNGNGRADTNEIRLYNAGGSDGYEVECASCHDPHGVPSGGPGSQFNPTFLRVTNVGSAVCQSCHSK